MTFEGTAKQILEDARDNVVSVRVALGHHAADGVVIVVLLTDDSNTDAGVSDKTGSACVWSAPPREYTPSPASSCKQQARAEALQKLRTLRKEARDEIDRLIQFLDKTDDYVSRELEDSIDDNPHDDEGEAEPSLGSFVRMTDQSEAWLSRNPMSAQLDAEQDDADREDDDPAEEDPSGIADYDGLLEQCPSIYRHGERIVY